MNVTQHAIPSNVCSTRVRPVPPSSRSRGVAIILVIVCVAAAAVIGATYVASQLNAPQIVGNVNGGIEARYIADSGADLATAIMECETIDWRTAAATGVLVSNLPMGGGSVSITVKNSAGSNPNSATEYPIIVSMGKSGAMKQTVGAQVHAPLSATSDGKVDVDLSEFAAFGGESINVVSGWITCWPASPRADVGLPVKVGTNAITSGAITIEDAAAAPDAIGYVMASAPTGAITDSVGGPAPIDRKNFSTSETIPLPPAPTPDLSNLRWSSPRWPSITSNTTSVVNSDRRLNSLLIDNKATLTVDLAGGNRTIGISGPLTIQDEGALEIENGHLDLVVQGNLNVVAKGVLCLGPGASLTLWVGGAVTIDDSAIGLPLSLRSMSRDAQQGLDAYYDPQLCTLYRIHAINSTDLNLVDFDDATNWVWSDNTVKSWIISSHAYVCARIYGYSKVALSIDSQSAVFGNVVANSVTLDNNSAIYYDHTLDTGCGYTNPGSPLYAAPLDLRDDVRAMLVDLNSGTIASVAALLAGAPSPTPFNPFAPTPRDKERVASRWWKHYGQKIKRDKASTVETVIANEGG